MLAFVGFKEVLILPCIHLPSTTYTENTKDHDARSVYINIQINIEKEYKN